MKSSPNKKILITSILSSLQKLGKSLMLPVAILPVAGLLLRFGDKDFFNLPFIQKAGDSIFSNLPILFAIGIAIGIAKESHGSAALAGAISFFVLTTVSQNINYALQLHSFEEPLGGYKALVASNALVDINMGVFAGIIAGLIAGISYNRFKDTKLPDWLQFFGGRRFVPIITGAISLVVGCLLGVIWPCFEKGLQSADEWISSTGAFALFCFGFLTRILIPMGLHHIVNSYAWFEVGSFTNMEDKVVNGDLNRFFAGDPNAGQFLSGFFPIMMFALPAVAFAIYICSKKKNRPMIGGMLFSVALTAFLTGITEPIEFMFVFLAPVLFIIHAILTGVSFIVCYMLNVHCGFTFSAGLTDYALNWGKSTNPALIIPIGVAFAVLYFCIFVFCIKKFDLKTPGREDDLESVYISGTDSDGNINEISKSENQISSLARQYVEALGGKSNIREFGYCITRFRLILEDSTKMDEKVLKSIGAIGIVKLSKDIVQVVVGTKAELIASEIKKLL